MQENKPRKNKFNTISDFENKNQSPEITKTKKNRVHFKDDNEKENNNYATYNSPKKKK